MATSPSVDARLPPDGAHEASFDDGDDGLELIRLEPDTHPPPRREQLPATPIAQEGAHLVDPDAPFGGRQRRFTRQWGTSAPSAVAPPPPSQAQWWYDRLKSSTSQAQRDAAAAKREIEYTEARIRRNAARRIGALLCAGLLRSRARALCARAQERSWPTANHYDEYNRLESLSACSRERWFEAMVHPPMLELRELLGRVDGVQPPTVAEELETELETEARYEQYRLRVKEAQRVASERATALLQELKQAHPSDGSRKHAGERAQLLRRWRADAEHNKRVAHEMESFAKGRHSQRMRATLPPPSPGPQAPSGVPAVRPDECVLKALCGIKGADQRHGHLLVGWRVVLGTETKPVSIDGQRAVYAGWVKSYGPPAAGGDFDHVVEIDLRRNDGGTWTPDTGKPYRANLLSRRQVDRWSFAHEQLGQHPSGAPCGVCHVRCVYGSQSCPRCMPTADGDELAAGSPFSRVQASDGLRHRRDPPKATLRGAHEELGAADEFEHEMGAEVLLEIEGELPLVATVLKSRLNWGRFEYSRNLTLEPCCHRWRLLVLKAIITSNSAAGLSAVPSAALRAEKAEALGKMWARANEAPRKMLAASKRAEHVDWSHSYDVEVQTATGPEVHTVRSSALCKDIVFDSDDDDDDDDDDDVRTYEDLGDGGESDDSYVDPELELRALVDVPDKKARLAKKRPDGQSSRSKLNRKHAVTAAAKAPLERISGGKPLEGCVVARRAPETVDQAREHREIREFLDGTVTGTAAGAAAPTITAAGALRQSAEPTPTPSPSPTPTPAPPQPPPTPEVPGGAPPAVDLLRMHHRVPPKRTPATKTGRDTSVTQQYHFGVTVADQDCSNAAALELVLDGRRVSPAAVKAMPMAERQRVTRHPVMRLQRNSWVLHKQILGPHIERRLRRLWP